MTNGLLKGMSSSLRCDGCDRAKYKIITYCVVIARLCLNGCPAAACYLLTDLGFQQTLLLSTMTMIMIVMISRTKLLLLLDKHHSQNPERW